MKRDRAAWQRLQALLDELLDLPSDEQQRRLAALPASEAALRDEAAAILAHDRETVGLLDEPAGVAFGGLLSVATTTARVPSDEVVGRQVGPYEIVGRLGAGGMAVVYAALQQYPARTIALKIMRAGLFADERQQRRFQREAENLARLSHPNIAAIHDAGVTTEGLHYFAMELVEGDPLDVHLSRRPAPDTREEIDVRVKLFLAICDAMTHAHQRGVIHLDLKPANVVVRYVDANSSRSTLPAAVKVLDFGVARFVGEAAAAGTFTQDERAIFGTLPYMSPEQAAGDRSAVDVRSDIYALGVLLYEMLTGSLPLDVTGCTLPEALRRIAEQVPARPEEQHRLLRGDLATILRKAMHVDPRERYQSVAALAEDLERMRGSQPILGRAPSTAYQLRKIVARHRVAITFSAALLATLLVAIAGTSFGLIRARHAQAVAREEAVAAEEAVSFLEQVFGVTDPSESRGNDVTARELLDRAVIKIADGLESQPQLQGRLLATMGGAYRNLGLYRDARPLLEQAVALQRETFGVEDARTATTHFTLASVMRRLGDRAGAGEHYQEALRIREKVLGSEHSEVAVSLAGLANLRVDEGEFREAQTLYSRCLDILARTVGDDSSLYATQLANRSIADVALGDLEGARASVERVVAIRRQSPEANDLDLAWSLSWLASLNVRAERFEEARALSNEALTIQEAVLGPDHTDVAETLSVLANLHRRAGDHAAALALRERTVAIWERALGSEHATYAMGLDYVARDLGSLGRLDEAIDFAERARAIFGRALPESHPSIAINLVSLGRLHLENGDEAQARALLRRALSLRETHHSDSPEGIAEVRELLDGLSSATADPKK